MEFSPFLVILALILLPIAVFRLCRLIIEDRLTEGFRELIWKKWPPETTLIGYFLTCYWCLSLWFALIMVVLYLLWPIPTLIVAAILAISAIASLIDHKLN